MPPVLLTTTDSASGVRGHAVSQPTGQSVTRQVIRRVKWNKDSSLKGVLTCEPEEPGDQSADRSRD